MPAELIHVAAPAEPLAVVEGAPVYLTSVEVWSDHVHLTLAGAATAQTRERRRREEDAHVAWARAESAGPPPQTSGDLIVSPRLTDDAGTRYHLTSGNSGGTGGRRLHAVYEPGPPPTATTLVVALVEGADAVVGTSVTALPGRSGGDGAGVRAATTADLPALLGLFAELHPGDPELSPAAAGGVWREITAQAGRTVLVGQVDGVVAGTLDHTVLPNLTRGGRPFMLIENVVVGSAYRRRGLGRALIGSALAVARARGCYKAQLLSRMERGEAHRFYESLGFHAGAQGYRLYF